MPDKLLLVGNAGETHIGSNLLYAAKELGLDIQFLDVREAYKGPAWRRKINWWLLEHRPSLLKEFSQRIKSACQTFQPRWMLSIGIAPVNKEALEEIGKLGTQRLNYLTDDPWNAAHKAGWFLKALPLYDHIFSVRRSNLSDLDKAGCSRVSYLPFAYAPELHFPESPETTEEKARFDCDIVFVGGADRDRIPYIKTLVQAGFKVHLYGGYWDRYPKMKSCYRGYADPQTFRKAIGGAKVSLCLVRHANRDGNSMRTFEIPAIGGCMLTEDTEEHREIFGEDGKAVVYFKTIPEMIEKLKYLLCHQEETQRLKIAAYRLIIHGKNAYKDRLGTMLQFKETKNG